MRPFLKQVAEHYYNIGDIESRCFVFPNRNRFVGKSFFKDSSAEQEDGVGQPQDKEDRACDDGVEQ